MSVRWEIHHDRKIVVVVAEGIVTTQEIHDYLRGVAAEGGMEYGKLLDTSRPDVRMPSAEEMRAVGLSMRDYTVGGAMGPLAIVVGQGSRLSMALFADTAGRHRRVQIFTTDVEALRWLERQLRSQK